ncbi:hypothetical protein M9458_010459, partial [Cirrhinus mrigala]
ERYSSPVSTTSQLSCLELFMSCLLNQSPLTSCLPSQNLPYVMPTKPGPAHKMAATQEPFHKMATTQEPLHKMASSQDGHHP